MASVLGPQEVAKIAHLARLALSPSELELYARQLAGILEYVEQLRTVPTDGVEPTSHPLALAAPFRDDEVRPSFDRGAALESAPDGDPAAGLFKVPRVIGA